MSNKKLRSVTARLPKHGRPVFAVPSPTMPNTSKRFPPRSSSVITVAATQRLIFLRVKRFWTWGSGGGKACFIASQIVGPKGKVIGVDMNDDMLELARDAAPKVAETLGFGNVTFHKGRIQDLGLSADAVANILADSPAVDSLDTLSALEDRLSQVRQEQPMVADGAVDVVISNCVLNLVRADQKARMFEEIFRVLRPGGRAVISDIVSDQDVPLAMQKDPELWSGCISGAYREDAFLDAFLNAGFEGVEVLERGQEPWQTVEDIEFRSVTISAFKPFDEAEDADTGRDAVDLPRSFRPSRRRRRMVFDRGEVAYVSSATAKLFAEGPWPTCTFVVPRRPGLPGATTAMAPRHAPRQVAVARAPARTLRRLRPGSAADVREHPSARCR